jgi:hypothetical protein
MILSRDNTYYHGYVEDVFSNEIRGWVFDPANPARPVTVCIKVNHRLLARVCALHNRPDIAERFGTHGRHGIVYRLPEELRSARRLFIEIISENGIPIANRRSGYSEKQLAEAYSPTDPKGPTKLFLHIPKTGGTAFRSLLRKSLSPSERLMIYAHPPGIPAEWFHLLTEAQIRQFHCVFGHFFFGLHENLPTECRYATVLRDPVQRVISHYFHHRRTGQLGAAPSWPTNGEQAGMELLGPPPSEEFDNLMVRLISGLHVEVGKVNSRTLQRAVRNLERHFDFVGILEEPETWPDLQAHFNLPGKVPFENVGDYDPAPFYTPSWQAHLTRANAYDVELYRYARKLAAERRVRASGKIPPGVGPAAIPVERRGL